MNEALFLLFSFSLVAACFLVRGAYKHRFLPIAQPLVYFGLSVILLCLLGIATVLEAFQPGLWLHQLSYDVLMNLVRPLAVCFWIWTLLEYHLDKKVSIRHKILIFSFCLPLLVSVLAIVHMLQFGVVPDGGNTTLVSPQERMGDALIFGRLYVAVLAFGILVATPFIVKKRSLSRHRTIEIVLLMLMTMLPYLLFFLRAWFDFTAGIGVAMMIWLLFWASHQYRLLDVLPVALQGVMEEIESGILVVNVESKLLYLNDCARQMFNLEVSKFSLKEMTLTVPHDVSQHFDFKKPVKQQVLIHRLEGGSEVGRYIDAILQPIFRKNSKKHLGSTIALHDVTDRKLVELELEKFNRQKSEFFAGVSHEFRTPLTLSLGGLDDVLNSDEKISKAQRDSLNLVRKNNERILNLVNQLMDFSSHDNEIAKIFPMRIPLQLFVSEMIYKFKTISNKQDINVHFIVNMFPNEDVVYFDPDALEKILTNLISNAFKSFTGMPDGNVYVHLDKDFEDRIKITVRDTGCGIAVDALPKIFDMFYSNQLENPVWPSGVGVGLYLVRQLVDQHGGEITAASQAGKGSQFTLSFMRGYEHFPEGIDVEHEKEWSAGFIKDIKLDLNSDLTGTASEGGTAGYEGTTQSLYEERVLVVEDNEELRHYIVEHLNDYQTIEAADGQIALDLSKRMFPDLIISDVMMPKLGGYDLCRQLKSDSETSHIPVILLTAKASQTEKLEGLSAGADDYIVKPFDARELKLRVKNMFSTRNALHECFRTRGLHQTITHDQISAKESSFLEKIRTHVLENIENSDIKIGDLASVAHMSERSLSRKVKALTGGTPKKMLQTIRVEQAARLLVETPESIGPIGYATGFNDASHFSRCFKAHFSMTPSEYRNMHLS